MAGTRTEIGLITTIAVGPAYPAVLLAKDVANFGSAGWWGEELPGALAGLIDAINEEA